jgi:hypothetical protein
MPIKGPGFPIGRQRDPVNAEAMFIKLGYEIHQSVVLQLSVQKALRTSKRFTSMLVAMKPIVTLQKWQHTETRAFLQHTGMVTKQYVVYTGFPHKRSRNEMSCKHAFKHMSCSRPTRISKQLHTRIESQV